MLGFSRLSMGEILTRQMGAANSVTARIIDEVAEREGVDPVELTSPLYEVIDAEALEFLFSNAISGKQREGLHVTFTYCGYSIAVDQDGEIEIRTE